MVVFFFFWPATNNATDARGHDRGIARLVERSADCTKYCNTAIPYSCYTAVMSEEHTFVTVQSRGLIAIPTAIRRHFGLDQPGAQVEVIEREGEIVLRPHVAVPADQAWFWTERWQRMEREADDAIAARRVTVNEDIDDLLADLDS